MNNNMQGTLVARRTQFSSCDECRRLRVRCDAFSQNGSNTRLSVTCTRCSKRRRQCTFEWMKDTKRHGKRDSLLGKGSRRRLRRRAESSTATSVTSSLHVAGSDDGRVLDALTPGFTATGIMPACSALDDLNTVEISWLSAIYRSGFDTIFGSWMNKYGCPFLPKSSPGNTHTTISEVCGRLDRWFAEMPSNAPANFVGGTDDQLVGQSLQVAVAAFSARWLPLISRQSQSDLRYQQIVQSLWRYVRRDMLRVINRPSYRSMLTLFLFALTPIPAGISKEEEMDGISGQACIHAGLQQIQMLRARQRTLQFNGTVVPASTNLSSNLTIPEEIEASEFIAAENIAYWAALTFDTSASLTWNSRPLLSSGLVGFEAELPWRLVRAGVTVFRDESQNWAAHDIRNMTDERANQIISSATAFKLLTWKLTAVFKEALRDGHNEVEIMRALSLVTEAMKQFDENYRGPLDECQKRMPFLGQYTRFRWYCLMLHYYLSILLLIDTIELADRSDLLIGLELAHADAKNMAVNILQFGLHSTITINSRPGLDAVTCDGVIETPLTLPLVSIDPYQHHILVAIQLVRRAVNSDLDNGKITNDVHASLHSILAEVLSCLSCSSKSVKLAQDALFQ